PGLLRPDLHKPDPKRHASPPRHKNPARPFRDRAEDPAPRSGKSRVLRRPRRPVADPNLEEIFRSRLSRRVWSWRPLHLRVSRWLRRTGAETKHEYNERV